MTFHHLSEHEPIHIMGIGNLGKLLAHALKKESPETQVTLLFHRRSLLEEWNQAGGAIEIVSDGLSDKQHDFNIEVLPDIDRTEQMIDAPIKNLIVATKTYTTAAAVGRLRSRISPETNILFVQNGMGSVDEVTEQVFPDPSSRPRYLAGIISHGVYSRSTFSSVHAGFGTTILGEMLPRDSKKNAASPGSRYMVDRIRSCPVLAVTEVTAARLFEAQLEKLIINAMINPLTVIFDCRNKELYGRPPILRLMQKLLSEASAVVRQLLSAAYEHGRNDDQTEDIKDRFSNAKLEALVKKVAVFTGENISSMLQDARAGRETEIAYINGYIVKEGYKAGIPCPANRKLVDLVKEKSTVTALNELGDYFADLEEE